MKCPNCCAENITSAKFCKNCGEKFLQGQVQAVETRGVKYFLSRRYITTVLVVVVGVAAIGVGAWFVYDRWAQNKYLDNKAKQSENQTNAIPSASDNAKEKKSQEEVKTVAVNEDVIVGEVKWNISLVRIGNQINCDIAGHSEVVATTEGRIVQFVGGVENLSKDTINSDVTNLMSESGQNATMSTSNRTDRLIDSQGRTFLPNMAGRFKYKCDKIETLFPSSLTPNRNMGFITNYEIPADATGLKLEVNDLLNPSQHKAFIDLGI